MATLTIDAILGSKVAEARTKADLTQGEVIAQLRRRRIVVSQAGLSRYEKGDRPIPHETLFALDRVFGLDPGELFSRAAAEVAKRRRPPRSSDTAWLEDCAADLRLGVAA